MAMAKINALGDEALVHRELQLERDLIQATFRHKTGQLEDTSQIGKLRRDLARTRTVQRQRELSQGLRKNALREQFRGSFKPGTTTEEAARPGATGILKGIASRFGIGGDKAEDAE